MAIEWAPSAFKHGVTKHQALYAMTHAVAYRLLKGLQGDDTRVFVGPASEFADGYLEVIVALHRRSGRLTVFHAMELTEYFRYLLAEGTNDEHSH